LKKQLKADKRCRKIYCLGLPVCKWLGDFEFLTLPDNSTFSAYKLFLTLYTSYKYDKELHVMFHQYLYTPTYPPTYLNLPSFFSCLSQLKRFIGLDYKNHNTLKWDKFIASLKDTTWILNLWPETNSKKEMLLFLFRNQMNCWNSLAL